MSNVTKYRKFKMSNFVNRSTVKILNNVKNIYFLILFIKAAMLGPLASPIELLSIEELSTSVHELFDLQKVSS